MAQPKQVLEIETLVQDILTSIEKEREREIISRRFGLFDRKETLEQIGELLGITRERVRQLEKAVLTKLKTQTEKGSIPHIATIDTAITTYLAKNGNIARTSTIAKELIGDDSKINQSRVAFVGILCPNVTYVDENDYYYPSLALSAVYNDKNTTKAISDIVATIKTINEPTDLVTIAEKSNKTELDARALASTSKQIATLNNRWGLIKWPMVNPKNIRDKIYVILFENGKQMHFSEISEAIKKSEFKRKNVTTQAIHNELIKDNRFVLVGRGIYALKEWGYKKGTVADVISEVLTKAGEPLHRDEIVKRVLKNRYVKETTILLNLQGKPQFRRVAKATYSLAE